MKVVLRYIEQAQMRARRRKSLWNFLLVPLALLGMSLSWWVLSRPIFLMRQWGMPENGFLQSGTRVGLIFFYIGLMLCSVAPGFLFANVCARIIPATRKVFDHEAIPHPGTDFKSANRALTKFGLIVLAVFFPIALIGGMNYYCLNSEGVFYRDWFSFQVVRHDWRKVKEVRTQCYSRKSAGEGAFILIFDDGCKIDLFSSTPKSFFPAYPSIANAIKGTSFDFYFDPPPTLYQSHPCPRSWESYFTRRPGN